ncbi:MAG TPA: sigma 54-interacting transcriptional regulator [Firmicutes bacterium]|nr:sigma 54-interacting transcriptional regulator [Candidatus Fermentithermobacillaceae bacterium]
MNAREALFENIFNVLREGVIVVQEDGSILYANQRSKALLGLGESVGPGHGPGTASPGDIVLLADSCLGADDGGLSPKDLTLLGIASPQVAPGQAVIAIGVLNGPPGTGTCLTRTHPSSEPLLLYRLWPGLDGKSHKLSVRLSEAEKHASISVDNLRFDFEYQIAVGHMVLLDPETLSVKFYQTLGYTARGEDPRRILLGGEFRAKRPGKAPMDIVGEKIWKVCPDGLDSSEIARVFAGEVAHIGPKEGYINGIPLRYAIVPIRAPEVTEKIVCILLNDLVEVKELAERVDGALTYASVLRMRLGKSISAHPAFSRIVGKSRLLAECVRLAEKIAPARCNVLLLGESGTGKNLFAKAIHQASPRQKGPFIVVNCAAIPPTLMESELFGYAPGSFTGALKGGKKGKFQEANGGTLLLDEVSELDPACQAKLLHAIEEGTIQPLGSTSNQKVDVRIIAATNQDLRKLVAEGKFREDLYYRLNVFPIEIPPLRERPEDIAELVETFLQTFSAMYGKRLRLTEACFHALLTYTWPGNVRELENVLERAAALTDDGLIDLRYMPPHIRADDHSAAVDIPSVYPLSLDEARKDAERNAILQAIQYCHGNHTKAMKILKISRTTFYQKLKELNIPSEIRLEMADSRLFNSK